MSTLICKATGLLSAAATWGVAEVGTGALNLIRQGHTSAFVAAGTQASAAFTVTNTKVIDGVLLWVRQSQIGSTGTFKVDLQKGGVSQASVTVNKTDLPDLGLTLNNNAPVFFKFTGTATGDGGANWTIVVTTTGTGTVNYCTHVSGATNFTRALRTTTTQAPVATDDLYVTGELTGAATHNSLEVTMNSTAATAYGNGAVNSTTVSGGTVAISNWGTLTYGTTASTNYIFRVAGDLRVYQYGTLNIGSAGAEIPRTSTAVLEFVQVSVSGDFGLIANDYATVNMAGLSRTSGKNVTKCKLTSDLVTPNLFTFSTTTAAGNNFTHDLEATGTSMLAGSVQENTANSTHNVYFQGVAVTNVTQSLSMWVAQGIGPANNRYIRVTFGNNAVFTSVTNGFWADVDLQAGTISAITNIGTGVGTSATITASGAGWVIRLVGKLATTSANPILLINACSAAGTVTYLGASNWNFQYDHVGLVTAASIPDTTFNVDTDTGWLSGDTICITATSRTAAEATLYSLNANAGASSFTSALYQNNVQQSASLYAYTCSGTAPTQATIGLVTRNVRVRSTSTTLMAYFYCSALATVTVSWAEIYRLGGASVGRRGIEFDTGTTANPKSFTYCSIHDFAAGAAFYTSGGGTSYNLTVTNTVVWFMTAQGVNIISAITNTDWVFDNNVFMRGGQTSFNVADVGGTITNNVVCSCAGNNISLAESNAVLGTFDNNVIHSGGSSGIILSGTAMTGIISNCSVWRITGGNGGVWYNAMCPDLVLSNLTLFGNTTTNLVYGTSGGVININTAVMAGETLYPTTNGFVIPAGTITFNLNNVDMTGVGGTLAPHTNDFNFNSAPADPHGQCNNCKFGGTNIIAGKANWATSGYLGFQKYGQVAGEHRCEMKYGQIKTDAVIFNTATPSQRMTPITGGKLESAPETFGVKIPVNNGTTVDVATWFKKSGTIDSAVYNGNQPRLIQRANGALGQIADVVLATASDSPASVSGIATLDSSTAALVTLSSGSLVSTSSSSTSAEQGSRVHSSAARTSGKFYFELITAWVGSSMGNMSSIGVGPPTLTFTNMSSGLGVGGGVIMQIGTSNCYSNAVSAFALGAPAPNVRIGCAVDLDNRKIWWRQNGGSWDAFGGAHDPVANTGGAVVPAGAMVPFICMGGSGNVAGVVFTVNFGATPFTDTPPAGFGAWQGPTFSSSWVQIAGTSSVATDDGIWEFVLDCDGGAGWLNVDDWTIAGAATTANGEKNWYGGIPVIGGGGGGGGGVPGYFAGGFTG